MIYLTNEKLSINIQQKKIFLANKSKQLFATPLLYHLLSH